MSPNVMARTVTLPATGASVMPMWGTVIDPPIVERVCSASNTKGPPSNVAELCQVPCQPPATSAAVPLSSSGDVLSPQRISKTPVNAATHPMVSFVVIESPPCLWR
jgi:hypothetical protein